MPSYFTSNDTRPYLAIVVLRSDGMVFDFQTRGWAALGADGLPTADQMQRVTHPVPAGPLAGNIFATLPDIPSEIDGMTAALVQLDAGGKAIAQVDQSPVPYVSYAGGTFRRI